MAKPSKKQQKSDQRTLVTFLLDRTGSMQAIKDDTIGAFNAYLEGLQQSGEPIDFTLIQFDSQSLDKLCVRVPVAQATKLDHSNFQPRACTPLIDAAYKTIKAVEGPLNGSNPKIVICFQTDGYENASTEHTWDQLNALIKEKTALGWQFNFMGASIDAYDVGSRMGVQAGSTMSYDSTKRHTTQQAFRAMSASTANYASGATMDTMIPMAAKLASGDAYVGKHQPAQQTVSHGVAVGAAPLSLGSGFTTVKAGPAPKAKPIVDKFSL